MPKEKELLAQIERLESELVTEQGKTRRWLVSNYQGAGVIENFPLHILKHELAEVSECCSAFASWIGDDKASTKEHLAERRGVYAELMRRKSQLEGAVIVLSQYVPEPVTLDMFEEGG
jgi:hypothetical protein